MVNNKRQQLQDRLILPSFFPLAVRSLLFWSLEHVYSRPDALSVLHRFCHLSVLSNAWDQYLSERSLPNVQGVVCLSSSALSRQYYTFTRAHLRPCLQTLA